VRQVHRQEVDLPFHSSDHRQRFAKVDLRVPRIVAQRMNISRERRRRTCT